jgi:hypothetical protein
MKPVYGLARADDSARDREQGRRQGGEKTYRGAIVHVLEGLPPAQAQPEALAAAKKQLAALDAPAAKK